MLVSILVAMDNNRVIGYQNQLPWHLPADLKRFKSITMGKPMIMGRNTYDSLGKPLPGRKHIVVTSRPLDAPADVVIPVNSLAKAFAIVSAEPEVSVIGGQQIFQQALPFVQRIYLTHIHHNFAGDVFFPELGEEWKKVNSEFHPQDEQNAYAFTYELWEK